MADDADELVSRFRDPPGWSQAILRTAALSFGAATTANDISAHDAPLQPLAFPRGGRKR
jgi:hypothetical protein